MNFITRFNWRFWLISVLVVSLVVSLAHSFYFRIQPAVDAGAYDAIAMNILNGFGYRQGLDLPLEKDNGIGRVGPGYEFFLTAVYFIFGHRYDVVWILQAFFHTLSAFLVFLIAADLLGADLRSSNPDGLGYRRIYAAIFSSALIGFSPDLIIGSSMLLTETLAIVLMLSAVYLFLRYYDNAKAIFVVPLAAIFGYAVLTRSALVLILVLFLFHISRRRAWPHLVLFFLVFAAIFTPWTIRNFKVYRAFVPTHLTFGDDLLAGNNPLSTGELEESRIIFSRKYDAYDIPTAERLMAQDTIWFIITHPFHFLKTTLYRISMYFSFSRPTGWWPYLNGSSFQPAVLVFSSLYSVAIFTLGFFGIFSTLKRLSPKFFYLLSFLAAIVLPIVLLIVETRYRYPSYPFFAVFAGLGVYNLVLKRSGLIKQFLLVFFVLSGNTLFDVLRNWSRIAERLSRLI